MYGKSISHLLAILSVASVCTVDCLSVSGQVRSTRSMRTIDAPTASNQTWMHPSEIAKDCLNSEGKTMVEVCQSHAEQDYDPARINTTKSTTWETCCALYEELDCYLGNAKVFCPDSTRMALVNYTQKVVIFFQDSLCHTVIHLGWKQWCNNQTHEAMAQYHRKDNHQKQDFIKLPMANGPEKKCFEKLRHSTVGNLTNVNQEQKCLNSSLNRWDPNRDKVDESYVLESCCAIYDTLDCIQQESNLVCDQSDAVDMTNYRVKSLSTLSATICKKVPSHQAHKLCYGTSAGYSVLSSALATLTTFLLLWMLSSESV